MYSLSFNTKKTILSSLRKSEYCVSPNLTPKEREVNCLLHAENNLVIKRGRIATANSNSFVASHQPNQPTSAISQWLAKLTNADQFINKYDKFLELIYPISSY